MLQNRGEKLILKKAWRESRGDFQRIMPAPHPGENPLKFPSPPCSSIGIWKAFGSRWKDDQRRNEQIQNQLPIAGWKILLHENGVSINRIGRGTVNTPNLWKLHKEHIASVKVLWSYCHLMNIKALETVMGSDWMEERQIVLKISAPLPLIKTCRTDTTFRQIHLKSPWTCSPFKPISSSKCEHKLAYNVSGLIYSAPANQRRSIF